MIDKRQSIAIALSTFTEKLVVDSVDFSYAEDTTSYKTLCGPLNMASISYNETSSCTITSDTSLSLSLLYELGIGSKSVALGVTTFSSFMNNTLVKVLEDFPEQTIEHSNMSVESLELSYKLNEVAKTTIKLRGNTLTALATQSLPLVYSEGLAVKTSDITFGSVQVVDLVVTITNTYKDFTCMSSEFLGKLNTDKQIAGSMLFDGAVKGLTSDTLQVTSDSHGLNLQADIVSLKEKVIDGVVYTEAQFVVPDNNLSVYFK